MNIVSDVIQHIAYPIYTYDLNDLVDADVISGYIRNYRLANPESNTSNVMAWHSAYHTQKHTPLFDHLIKVIEDKVYELCKSNDEAFDNLNIKPVVDNCWAIVYKKGDHAEWHNHGNRNCYSTVYYAETNDDTPLVFEDLFGESLEIKPTKGLLVVFPSMAHHMVPEIVSDKERLAFAANLVYVGKTGE